MAKAKVKMYSSKRQVSLRQPTAGKAKRAGVTKKITGTRREGKMGKAVTYEGVDDPVLPEVRKTAQMAAIEAEYGRDIRLIIRDLYNMHGNQRVVAEELGIEQSTVTYWALRLNIQFTQQPVAIIQTL